MSQKYSQDEAQALVKALKEGNQLAFSIVYKTYVRGEKRSVSICGQPEKA